MRAFVARRWLRGSCRGLENKFSCNSLQLEPHKCSSALEVFTNMLAGRGLGPGGQSSGPGHLPLGGGSQPLKALGTLQRSFLESFANGTSCSRTILLSQARSKTKEVCLLQVPSAGLFASIPAQEVAYQKGNQPLEAFNWGCSRGCATCRLLQEVQLLS